MASSLPTRVRGVCNIPRISNCSCLLKDRWMEGAIERVVVNDPQTQHTCLQAQVPQPSLLFIYIYPCVYVNVARVIARCNIMHVRQGSLITNVRLPHCGPASGPCRSLGHTCCPTPIPGSRLAMLRLATRSAFEDTAVDNGRDFWQMELCVSPSMSLLTTQESASRLTLLRPPSAVCFAGLVMLPPSGPIPSPNYELSEQAASRLL